LTRIAATCGPRTQDGERISKRKGVQGLSITLARREEKTIKKEIRFELGKIAFG